MINRIFQLIKPGFISVKYIDESFLGDKVIVKPLYVSLCHADQRYYLGKRDPKVLEKKFKFIIKFNIFHKLDVFFII